MKASRTFEITQLAESLLTQIDSPIFPLKASNLIKLLQKSYTIKLIKFSEFAETANMSLEEVYKLFCTRNARIIFDAKAQIYYIYYNDTMCKERCRWNIIHELAHLILGHCQKAQKVSTLGLMLSDDDCATLEKEANYFTSYCLAPYPLIMFLAAHYGLLNFNGYYIFARSVFKLSKEASYYLANTLSKRTHTQITTKSFEPFIDFIFDFVSTFPQYSITCITMQKYLDEIPYIKHIIDQKQKGIAYNKRLEYWTIGEILEDMLKVMDEQLTVEYA